MRHLAAFCSCSSDFKIIWCICNTKDDHRVGIIQVTPKQEACWLHEVFTASSSCISSGTMSRQPALLRCMQWEQLTERVVWCPDAFKNFLSMFALPNSLSSRSKHHWASSFLNLFLSFWFLNMGCSSSSAQTVDQEKRPGTKPEETNGDTLGKYRSAWLEFVTETQDCFHVWRGKVLEFNLLKAVSAAQVHSVLSAPLCLAVNTRHKQPF